MGTFMNTSKNLVVKAVNSSNVLEIDQSVSLAFYIRERVKDTVLSTIEYKVDKVSGRVPTSITTWTGVSLVGVEDDIYEFDYTLSGVTISDKVIITFRIIDEDGIEYYVEIADFTIII